MSTRLESVDQDNWEEFLSSPTAVLVLGKTTCRACSFWSRELSDYLEQSDQWPNVRFGKMLLDLGGLQNFKKDNPWLAEVDVLPYNIIYTNGEIHKRFAGSGLERLLRRLEKIAGASES